VPLTRAFGITGVAWTVTTYAVVMNLYAVWRAMRECAVPGAAVLEALLVPLVAGGGAAAAVVGLRALAFADESLLALLALGAIGVLVYALLVGGYDLARGRAWRADLTDVVAAMRQGGSP
jgi:hypothetical protein